jgi:hypothetical protein
MEANFKFQLCFAIDQYRWIIEMRTSLVCYFLVYSIKMSLQLCYTGNNSTSALC